MRQYTSHEHTEIGALVVAQATNEARLSEIDDLLQRFHRLWLRRYQSEHNANLRNVPHPADLYDEHDRRKARLHDIRTRMKELGLGGIRVYFMEAPTEAPTEESDG